MKAERIGAPGPRPKMQLVGADGNAFAIVGRARKAARAAGWTPEQIDRLQEEMTAGSYSNLLGVAVREFDDVGTRDEEEDEDDFDGEDDFDDEDED